MTPDEIIDARVRLGLSQSELAAVLGMSDTGRRTIARWEGGELPISGAAALAIRYMLEYGLPGEALKVR